MNATRRAIALAAVLALAGAGAATAAKPKPKPKPLCNLVTDAAGDVKTGNESLDVVGGDVATNGKVLTAVIRLKKLSAQDLTSPTGRYYELAFAYEGRGQQITAVVSPAGTKWYGGNGTGTFDLAKNEVRIHVPVDNLIGRPALKPGTPLTNIAAKTDLGNPAVAFPTTLLTLGDTGQGTKPYPVNAASCVKVGA